MQTPLQSPPRSSSQPEREHIKKDKRKKVMCSDEAEKESTKSDSNKEAHVTGSMVKSSKKKNLKKFDFVIEDGRHIYLFEEQINNHKKLEEEAKAEVPNRKGRQDFITIEDWKDFSNAMLYIVQEIFFKIHQGPRMDDDARTFSFLLLAKVDKRNLNPLKQLRTIEQLRQ
uniref:Uncharacterized protein n=1 Tax=Tanacetum cinerariifolium TaxID=118510 RepID=A0A6L2JF99_TANCI|nr:hypothetical protein [Tanacetum cinerariifolium]